VLLDVCKSGVRRFENMDPTVEAMLAAMREQQEKFMTAISSLAKTEGQQEPSTSAAPKFDSFDKAKERF